MSFLQIIQLVIGIPLVLFVPGFLIAKIFFDDLTLLEKIGLGLIFSIVIDIIIGLFLGYNQYMKELTGGISVSNMWIYLGTLTVILFCVWLLRNRKQAEKIFYLKSKGKKRGRKKTR